MLSAQQRVAEDDLRHLSGKRRIPKVVANFPEMPGVIISEKATK